MITCGQSCVPYSINVDVYVERNPRKGGDNWWELSSSMLIKFNYVKREINICVMIANVSSCQSLSHDCLFHPRVIFYSTSCCLATRVDIFISWNNAWRRISRFVFFVFQVILYLKLSSVSISDMYIFYVSGVRYLLQVTELYLRFSYNNDEAWIRFLLLMKRQ